MNKPLMAKATAVWLVDNTTLSFKQIADFCGMHELEVQGIADGDVATGVKGFDPIASNQLDMSEIEKGQKDPRYRLKLKHNPPPMAREKAPRPALYAPVQASGPARRDPVAGQVPSRTGRCADCQAGRDHEADHRLDPRPHALEHPEHPAHRPGRAGPVPPVGTGCRRAEGRQAQGRRGRRDDR